MLSGGVMLEFASTDEAEDDQWTLFSADGKTLILDKGRRYYWEAV
jgi:hypothetical protein